MANVNACRSSRNRRRKARTRGGQDARRSKQCSSSKNRECWLVGVIAPNRLCRAEVHKLGEFVAVLTMYSYSSDTGWRQNGNWSRMCVCIPGRRYRSNKARPCSELARVGNRGKGNLGIGNITVVPVFGIGLVLAVAVTASWTATHFSG